MSKNENITAFYIGSMISSVVGGILLLFTDFSGWNGSNYYLSVYSWGYFGPNTEDPISIVPFLIIAGMLFYCTYISYLGFQGNGVESKLLNQAYWLAFAAMVVCIIFAIVFVILISEEDVEWWFDAGFYGGIIGSALTVVFLYQVKKE